MQGIAQPSPGLDVGRPEFDCGAKRDGSVGVAGLFMQEIAQIIVSCGEAGIQCDCAAATAAEPGS